MAASVSCSDAHRLPLDSKVPAGDQIERLEGRMKYTILLIPCIAALAAPLYNRVEPTLAGVPFFYWFQLALIPMSVIFMYAVYRGEAR